MSDGKSYTSIHYHSYLQLDKLLDSQDLMSEKAGQPAHDEMLFIIVHQVYELWFKEIIHDMGSVRDLFAKGAIDERNLGLAISRLNRVIEIQKLLVQQILVMETMTPLDFLDFRHHLFPASGFQSYQFRQIETMLGLPSSQRLTYNQKPYHIVFRDEQKEVLSDLEAHGTIFAAIEQWLERTPFLDFGDFNFLESYTGAVKRMMESERDAIKAAPLLSEESKAMRLEILQNNEDYILAVTDPVQHEQMRAEGKLRLSYRATMAALLINLYRDEPILHQPYILLQKLSEIDEGLTAWRTRHAQMVLRMLGRKMGTGGSSGHDYLAATAAKHSIFSDFHNISTLLIPRSELPVLPYSVRDNLNFHYSVQHT